MLEAVVHRQYMGCLGRAGVIAPNKLSASGKSDPTEMGVRAGPANRSSHGARRPNRLIGSCKSASIAPCTTRPGASASLPSQLAPPPRLCGFVPRCWRLNSGALRLQWPEGRSARCIIRACVLLGMFYGQPWVSRYNCTHHAPIQFPLRAVAQGHAGTLHPSPLCCFCAAVWRGLGWCGVGRVRSARVWFGVFRIGVV